MCCGPPPSAPEIAAGAAAARPENVLSVLVTGRARFADSVAVRYGIVGGALDSVTPAEQPADSEVALPVFGLLPETEYELQIIAYGDGTTVSGDLLHITTRSLPADLPRFVAGGPAPSPGYVLFASGNYGIVIDNSGRVVWYVRFDLGPSLNFQAQPNGRYVARPTSLDPSDVEPLIELDPLGNVTRTLDCARGLRPRFHDLLVEPNGSYWLMCDEIREMDLSGLGGVAGAKVTGTVVQHIDAAGNLLFDWSPFDHFDITDATPDVRSGPQVNWTHGNALDLDSDGNLVVSFRSLSEITKIDTKSGAVLWRMGGFATGSRSPTRGRRFYASTACESWTVGLHCWTTSENRTVAGRSGTSWMNPAGPHGWPRYSHRRPHCGRRSAVRRRVCRMGTRWWRSATAARCRSSTTTVRWCGRSKGIRATSSAPNGSGRCITRRSGLVR